MTNAGADPMHDNTRRLVEALTTARSFAQSADGFLVVEAYADGQMSVRIDDRALRYGGSAVAAELTRLAGQALTSARAEVRAATETFRADPRIEAVIEATQAAMDQPLPPTPSPSDKPARNSWAAQADPGHDAQDRSARPSHPTNPEPRHGTWSPQPTRSRAPDVVYPSDYDEDGEDGYYQRKSWLV